MFSLGLALAAVTFCAGSAAAQTVAVGPYYATPSWDQKLQCDTTATCPRFVVLSNWTNQAVLDRETGVVFEAAPAANSMTWRSALSYCANKTVGNKKGWRLPTAQELANLYDPSGNPQFALPAGHPFTVGAFINLFWTATEGADTIEPTAYIVSFTVGGNDGAFPQPQAGSIWAWCVRGGGVVAPQ